MSASQMLMLVRETIAANRATTRGRGQKKTMLNTQSEIRRRTRAHRSFILADLGPQKQELSYKMGGRKPGFSLRRAKTTRSAF